MGNNYCKGLSVFHPISSNDFDEVWSGYMGEEGTHTGALTPAVAKKFIFDFAEALSIPCDDALASRLLSQIKTREDGKITREEFRKLFFSVANEGKATLTQSLAASPARKLKVLFFNVPLHGHVNPSLDLVSEIVSRGHSVTYYTSENFRDKIEHTGATFIPYSESLEFKTTREITNIYNTGREMLKAAEQILADLVPTIPKDYDLIVYDVSAVWGKFLGYILDIPAICMFPGLAPKWRSYIKSRTIITRGIQDSIEGQAYVSESKDIMSKLSNTYKIPNLLIPKLFSGSPLLNIVCTSAYMQPYSSDMDKTFIFMGPSLHTRVENVEFPWDQVDSSKKLIYISMGTLYKQDPAFFSVCIEAFKNSPYQVIMSVGKGTDIATLEPIPPNFIVKNYVPQPSILEKTDVFISHAGMGGISEAMYFNVPMLLLPKTIEQQLNARRISKLGAAIDLRSASADAQQLQKNVEILLKDPSYKANAKVIGDTFKSTAGVAYAVDALEEAQSFYRTSTTSSLQSRLEVINNSIKRTFCDFSDMFSSGELEDNPFNSPPTSPRSSGSNKDLKATPTAAESQSQ